MRVAVVGAGIVGTSIALRAAQARRRCDAGRPRRARAAAAASATPARSARARWRRWRCRACWPRCRGCCWTTRARCSCRCATCRRALPWLLRFVASAHARARRSARPRHWWRCIAGAVDAHDALARELGVPELFLRRGHLHLYPDAAALAKDAGGWRMREAYGYPVERLDRAGIWRWSPASASATQVGMYLADHATILNPLRYVQAIVRAFASPGGRLRRARRGARRCRRSGWRLRRRRCHWRTVRPRRRLPPARGPRACSIRSACASPLESQRGYHVQFRRRARPCSRTVVLADRKVFVTPMEEGLRVGGTVEIAGLDRAARPAPRRDPRAHRARDIPGPRRASAPHAGWAIGPACRTRCRSSGRRRESPACGSRSAMATWA